VVTLKMVTTDQIGYWAKGDRQVVVQIAIDHGMELGDEKNVWTPDEMADKAQAWLNENVVPEGLRFDWWGIYFILMPEESWKAQQQGS
jgi:hypothetical protein